MQTAEQAIMSVFLLDNFMFRGVWGLRSSPAKIVLGSACGYLPSGIYIMVRVEKLPNSGHDFLRLQDMDHFVKFSTCLDERKSAWAPLLLCIAIQNEI